jgi:hypothetical protein
MVQEQTMFKKLNQERKVIRANTSRIEDLSQDLTNLANLQGSSQDITLYQSNLVNEKRINLRNNIINFKEGLEIHYTMEEEALLPLISVLCLKSLINKHIEIITTLSDINIVILNLNPVGMLVNSDYLKEKISAVFVVLRNLNCQENSLLAYSGIGSEE